MAISSVKAALAVDLAAITTANGYSTNTAKVYKVPKMLHEVDTTYMPAWSVFLINSPALFDNESGVGYELNYGIIAFNKVDVDEDESGDMENILILMFEDFVSKMKTGTTLKLDGVQEIRIRDFFPMLDVLKGQAYIPITIHYYGG